MWVNRQYMRRWTFFNDGKGAVKIDKTDVNIYAAREDDQETIISVTFSELPEKNY